MGDQTGQSGDGVAAALGAGEDRIALGVGALHVVDDNFLQPQPLLT